MAQQPLTPEEARIAALIPFIGIQVKGDLGPFTIYTNHRGRVVFYKRAPPTKPPTAPQIRQRTRFKLAQRLYQHESAATKAKWELLVVRSRICMTGQNLYVSLALNPQPVNLANLAAAAGLTITPPDTIPP